MSDISYIEWFPANGEAKLTFGANYPYKLRHVEGLMSNRAQSQTIRSPSQVGETTVDVDVSSRVIALSLMVAADTPEDLWVARRVLARAMTSVPARAGEDVRLGTLRLYRRGSLPPLDYIALPQDSPQEGQPVGGFVPADLEFLASYPYPRDIADTTAHFESAGGFEFPIELEDWEMLSFDVIQTIVNSGDVDAPVLAQLHGECTNPRLLNLTTGRTLQLIGEVAADEYLEVNTAFGKKSVVLVNETTGGITNAMSLIDLALDDFWSLQPGTNVVKFETDSNISGYMNLAWRQRYIGT